MAYDDDDYHPSKLILALVKLIVPIMKLLQSPAVKMIGKVLVRR